MKKFVFRKYKLKAYQRDALRDYLKPPEEITVSEWAEQHRILDGRSSAMPGPWRNNVTPYLTDIMDEFNNYETEEIVFCKPTQVGGTEAMQNMLGWIIAQDPGPTLIVYPTDTLAESTSDNRLQPMILAAPDLAGKYDDHGSSKLELQFDGMYASLAGSNSPSNLASKPIRYLFMDEVDKYPNASKKEADPISLSRERTKTFQNRKIYQCSTPTLRTGAIWKAKESADVEKHYFIPCPHCGQYIELKFSQIKWPGKEDGLSAADRAEFAVYVCQECACVVSDAEKNLALQSGQWRAVREPAANKKVVAFWLNTLYSPFVRFSEIAKEFMRSKDDPELLHNFSNSWLAEPWEDSKLKTNSDLVLERQTDIEAYILPDWTKLLTGGVDVQENCLYWTIRAWGDYLTSQNIAHGQAYSFAEIVKVMNLEFKKVNGDGVFVNLALVDSGDQTDEVYEFCAINSEWALPCKGVSNGLSHYRLSSVNKPGSKAFGMNLVLVDGGKYKDMIASRMRKPNGKGAWMVHKDCDQDYAEQVTAEHKVTERAGGRETQSWKLKTSHAANHYLDAEVYSMAAADILGVRNLFLQNIVDEEPAPEPPAKQSTPEENWIKQNENWI
ncbi:MAG: terminase [Firmicutes bacterium HGW-Firmicutes-16]|nr:MAG: terminase [Firmicutes bacterium HGW-Firmicutes-16]